MIDYIQIFICIITSIVYIIISLIIGQNDDLTLMRLIYVIIISYIAGLILKVYLKKRVFISKNDDKAVDEESQSTEGIEESDNDKDFNEDLSEDSDEYEDMF